MPYPFSMLHRVQFSRLNAMSKNVIFKGPVRVKKHVSNDCVLVESYIELGKSKRVLA